MELKVNKEVILVLIAIIFTFLLMSGRIEHVGAGYPREVCPQGTSWYPTLSTCLPDLDSVYRRGVGYY